MLTTLADDPRNKLPEWYLEIWTKARNLCSAHDAAGALSLIALDVDWQQFPGVLTNPSMVQEDNQPSIAHVQPLTIPLTTLETPQPPSLLYTDKPPSAMELSPTLLAYSLLRYWKASATPIGLTLRPHFTHCRCTPSPQRKS
jgi:hypothetical protein